MLNYLKYKKLIKENDGPFPADPDAPRRLLNKPAEPFQLSSQIQQELGRLIDGLVADLKRQIVSPIGPEAQRGMWDRIKNWWSNTTRGRYAQDNPYYWKNVLGDQMGQTVESLTPLEFYTLLKEQSLILEEQLPAGTEKLKIMQVIDNWAKKLKQSVVNMVHHKLNQEFMPTAGGTTSPEMPPTPPKEEKPSEAPSSSTEDEPDEPAPSSASSRSWYELNSSEQEEWDRKGGGVATPASKKARLQLGITRLPWILRIGDPRIEDLKKIRASEFYNRLKAQGRVEDPMDPIKNDLELRLAIVKAKAKYEEHINNQSARSKDRWRKKKGESTTEPTEPESLDEPVPAPMKIKDKEKEEVGSSASAMMNLPPPDTTPDDEVDHEEKSKLIHQINSSDATPNQKEIMLNWLKANKVKKVKDALEHLKPKKDYPNEDIQKIESNMSELSNFYKYKLRNSRQ